MKTSFSYLLCTLVLVLSLLILVDTAAANVNCGNGTIEGLEECDDGINNSDTLPDKCRSDCRLAFCGDGVIDGNEECDESGRNSDEIPGACRTDCREAYCGDGVVDLSLGEECDFGIDSSNCSPDCLSCFTPQDDMVIPGYINYTKLCSGEWRLSDSGSPGVLHLSSPYTMLDCNGARLIGDGNNSIGIQVSGEGSIVRNCDLSGFTTGIHITADAVGLYANKICGNYKDIINESDSHGLDNECSRITNWQEEGQEGCAQRCPARDLTPMRVDTGITGKMDPRDLNLKTQKTLSSTSSSVISNQSRLTGKQSNSEQTDKVARTTKKNVVHQAAAGYSFYQMADKARWVSSAGKVVFGSDRIPETGIARKSAETTRLKGKRVNSVLLTQPDQKTGGFIQGAYPFQRLNKNTEFSSTIALQPNAPRDAEARFEVIISEGKSKNVIASRKIKGGRTGQLKADLSRWAGKKGHLILRVTSVKRGQTPPPAIWVNPRLN